MNYRYQFELDLFENFGINLFFILSIVYLPGHIFRFEVSSHKFEQLSTAEWPKTRTNKTNFNVILFLRNHDDFIMFIKIY